MSQQCDPDKHHRRSIRLPAWDYRNAGAYFVTIVTHGRECLFRDSVIRRIVETMWKQIPVHFPHVALDEWVVMPNHIHGILIIADTACKGEAFPADPFTSGATCDEETSNDSHLPGNASPLRSGSVGAVVGNFKSLTSRRVNRIRHTPGIPLWQRNYYERVVRNEQELNAIRQYIINNPASWEQDAENPDHKMS